MTRTPDVYGHSLSASMGKSNGRTRFHNDLEGELAPLTKHAGLGAEHQPRLLFVDAIPPGPARERFAATQDASARCHHGGIVSSMLVWNMPRRGGSPVAQQPLEVKAASLCAQHA